MSFTITYSFGRWKVNGKHYKDCNFQEQKFLNDFWQEMKIKRE